MIGVDTNILLRIFIEDDPEQTKIARELANNLVFDGEQIFVNHVVMAEFVWVLETGLRKSRMEISAYLQAMFGNDSFVIQDREVALNAFALYAGKGFDLSDALIALGNQKHGCSTTLTFDRKAARLPEFQLPA